MKSNRMSRVNSEIQKSVQKIISEFDDKDLSSSIISIMKVDTYADFSCAKIYISTLGGTSDKNFIAKKLNENKKTIRFKLAHMITFKNVPDLMFVVDETDERADRVLKLFEQIEKELPEETEDESSEEDND